MTDHVKIIAPATVANVACGFDVLGFCLDNIGDVMTLRKTPKKGIFINEIKGFDLPKDPTLNVAGVSALAMYKTLDLDFGFEMDIHKKIKPGSGIGSSAASASGSVFAMNILLGNPFNNTQLTEFAMAGEALASQCKHADNLAPAIFGGFTLVKSLSPLQVLQIPSPADLYATIIHPQIEIKTADARAILPEHIPLKKGIEQWANFGSLIHALHTNDYPLIKASLHDAVIESYRSPLIPYFSEIKSTALAAGALGVGISGSGPAVFSLSQGREVAQQVQTALNTLYAKTTIPFEIHISKINTEGIKIY